MVDIPTCPIAVNTAKAVNIIFKTAKSHHQVVPVRANDDTENTVDAAVALPLKEDLLRDEILDIGRITGTREAELDITVGKSGRTTEYTSGTVDVVDTTATVAYGPGKIALFSLLSLRM